MNKLHKIKSLITTLTIFGFLIVSSNPATAHTELLKSSPAADKIISVMPKLIKLTFGEELLVVMGSTSKANSIIVKSPDNKIVSTGKVKVVANIASINLVTLKEFGKYQVIFRVVAEDGHVLKDSFKFEFRK